MKAASVISHYTYIMELIIVCKAVHNSENKINSAVTDISIPLSFNSSLCCSFSLINTVKAASVISHYTYIMEL